MRTTRSLDGRWQIAYDPGNVGKQRRWMEWARFVGDAPREYIDVPACWERFRQDYEGVAWYGLAFDVPSDWQGCSVSLQFGAANYLAEVYLNDQPVGYHEGGYTDFAFEIGDWLRYDAPNHLVLRIIGPIVTQDIVIDGIGRNDMPHWRGAITGGLWQSVTLEARHSVHVTDIFADPSLNGGTVHAEVSVANTTLCNKAINASVRVVPADGGAAIAQKAIDLFAHPGENGFELTLAIPDAEPWDLDNPCLYHLIVELGLDDAIIDTHSVRFGMRDFSIANGRYLLNGEPILIKSVFFEGLYPTTLAAPPNEAMVRREIELAKEAGFNLIRPWRKPQPPIVYDLADEMGMLFVGTMPIECMRNWPTMTPYAERRMRAEVRESVQRDRNHPSIIMWEIFNEIMRPSLQRIKPRVTREARKLDPSRMILDESGGFGGGAYVYMPNSYEPVQINDVHSYPSAPFGRAGYDSVLGISKTDEQLAEMGIHPAATRTRSAQVPGAFTHVSEIGYGSLPDLESYVERYRREGNPLTPDYRYHHALRDAFERALAFTGLDQLYPTVGDYCRATQAIHADANKRMVEAIRMNPDIAGFTIHAYTDGDWVVGAGLLDIFRNPKPAYWAAQETNVPVYLAVRVPEHNHYGDEPIRSIASVASELPDAFEGELTVQVVDAMGRVVATTEHKATIATGVAVITAGEIVAQGLAGLYNVTAQLTRNGETVAENTTTFRVVPRVANPNPSVPLKVCDPSGRLQAALSAGGHLFDDYAPGDGQGAFVLANAKGIESAGGAGAALAETARSGGCVVYLDLPAGDSAGADMGSQHLVRDWLPTALCTRPTRGLWTPFTHIIRDDIVGRGLPTSQAMGQDYANVYPQHSIVKVDDLDPSTPFVGLNCWSWLGDDAATAPVCTLGLGHRPRPLTDERDYRGPGPVVFGADLLARTCGDGVAVFCTLRLVDSLGRDPVADVLFANIIDWAAQARR